MNVRIIVTILFCAIYLLFFLPLYIIKERKGDAIDVLGYKLILSGLFSVMGLAAAIIHDFGVFEILILAGMISAIAGDYFLAFIFKDEKKFICGIYSFSLTQAFYISAMIFLSGIGIGEFLTTFLILVFLALVIMKLKPEMGSAKIPLSLYTLLVTFMAVKAVWIWIQGADSLKFQWMFTAGALLFWISDIFLGINRFIQKKYLFSVLVSTCYFLGQLMIALSVYYQ